MRDFHSQQNPQGNWCEKRYMMTSQTYILQICKISVTDWRTDWWTDWLVDRLIGGQTDWQTHLEDTSRIKNCSRKNTWKIKDKRADQMKYRVSQKKVYENVKLHKMTQVDYIMIFFHSRHNYAIFNVCAKFQAIWRILRVPTINVSKTCHFQIPQNFSWSDVNLPFVSFYIESSSILGLFLCFGVNVGIAVVM